MTLRADLERYLTPILEPELEVRRRQTDEAILAAKHELSARGLLRSGAMVRRVTEIVTTQFEAFGRFAFDQLVRVHEVMGLPHEPTLAADLAAIIEAAQVKARDMFMAYKRETDVSGKSFTTVPDDLNYAHEQSLKRIRAEIDLYALGLFKGSNPRVAGGAVHITVHGPVGAVMTGGNSTASVSQTITSDQKVLILSAIDAAEAAVKKAPESASKQELLEVVKECRDTVNAPKINASRLMFLLKGLAATLAGLGNAEAAYEAVQNALRAIGAL